MPSSRPHVIAAIVLCVASVAVVGSLELARRRGGAAGPAATAPAPPPPPTIQIATAVRQLKLVTWQFDATVSAQSVSDRWYGDAVASVRAPVRYQYGVDLTDLRAQDVLFATDASVVFIVPPPRRIAAEVDVERLEETLKTSGVRWRGANQSQLEDARKRLGRAAAELALSPDDERRLRDVSREQLEAHLGGVLAQSGRAGRVSVRFGE